MVRMRSAAKRSRSSGRRSCPLCRSWSMYAVPTRFTVHSTPPHISSGGRERALLFMPISLVDCCCRFTSNQLVEERERLRHDLVHVVVLVGREPADEVHMWRRLGQRLVLSVN